MGKGRYKTDDVTGEMEKGDSLRKVVVELVETTEQSIKFISTL